jgi:hypothetical protein
MFLESSWTKTREDSRQRGSLPSSPKTRTNGEEIIISEHHHLLPTIILVYLRAVPNYFPLLHMEAASRSLLIDESSVSTPLLAHSVQMRPKMMSSSFYNKHCIYLPAMTGWFICSAGLSAYNKVCLFCFALSILCNHVIIKLLQPHIFRLYLETIKGDFHALYF